MTYIDSHSTEQYGHMGSLTKVDSCLVMDESDSPTLHTSLLPFFLSVCRFLCHLPGSLTLLIMFKILDSDLPKFSCFHLSILLLFFFYCSIWLW